MDAGKPRANALAMTNLARATYGFLAIAAISGLAACKTPSDANGVMGGDAGANQQASDAGQAGVSDQAGQAGDTTTGGAGGAGTTQVSRGLILITQAAHYSDGLMQDIANASMSVIFSTRAEATREQGAAAVTTIGDCTASVVAIDPNAAPVMPTSGLNAGTITVTGIGMPPSFVEDYMDNGGKGPSNYGHAEAQTRFYQDGDVLSVTGAGGPDLPAFEAQTLTAPSDIVVTAPACVSLTCPDVAHTQDLLVEWENGGAGKVDVLFETVSDTKVVLLECKFDAQAGKGVVPTALLAKLDVVDADNVSGIEQITPIDEKTFLVGDVSTTFSIRSAEFEALLQPVN